MEALRQLIVARMRDDFRAGRDVIHEIARLAQVMSSAPQEADDQDEVDDEFRRLEDDNGAAARDLGGADRYALELLACRRLCEAYAQCEGVERALELLARAQGPALEITAATRGAYEEVAGPVMDDMRRLTDEN